MANLVPSYEKFIQNIPFPIPNLKIFPNSRENIILIIVTSEEKSIAGKSTSSCGIVKSVIHRNKVNGYPVVKHILNNSSWEINNSTLISNCDFFQ